jgi:2,4-dienoyl-CoA reductase (NADPH2)
MKESGLRKLFTPTRIGALEIRNRICMPALHLQYAEDRHCTERMVEFYRARAAGGCGLIIVGGIGIDLTGSGVLMPTIESDDYIPGFTKLADACHEQGAAIMLQLFHAGRYSFSRLIDNQQPVAPSAVVSRYTREEPRALLRDEILEIEKRFAAAAERAQRAGMDGVELCGSAGYLISQFLSPLTNKRSDQYGGSLENRARFARETIDSVRSAVGRDFVVTIRVAGNDFVPGSHTNVESATACRMFEEAGVDAISVTGGWHEARVPQLPMMVPRGAFTYLAVGIKREVSVPVLVSNRIVDPRDADRILCDGIADVVCVGRAQVADPEWSRKAKEDRYDEIRPCVGCMQGCLDRVFTGQPLCCLCNPQAGFERERRVTRAPKRKKVVVVGTGPAGLEAACVAAERGHHVVLFERGDSIGGQIWMSAAPPGRDEFRRLVPYYRGRLDRAGVDLLLNTEVTAKVLRKERPDAVILATGSEPLVPEIPGIRGENVCHAWDVLAGTADLGKKVVILGGGAVGVETAIFVASIGTPSGDVVRFLLMHGAEEPDRLRTICYTGTKQVTLIEMEQKVGRDIGLTTRWVLLAELKAFDVKTISGATVTEIRDNGVVYRKNGTDHHEPADTVVLALGSRPNRSLTESLDETGIPVEAVGDCVEPRKVMDAIHEAFLATIEL